MDPATLAKASADGRGKLGEALGALQDLDTRAFDVTKIVRQVASAQAALFDVGREGTPAADQLAGVARAMEHLAASLQLLQDVRDKVPQTDAASGFLAQALAMLYPLRQRLAGELPKEPAVHDPGTAPLPTKDDDLRKTVRVDLGTAIGGEYNTTFYTGFSENISSGGIFISTFNLQPINAKILVSFVLPDGQPVTARGRVRWVREYDPSNPDQPPGMGVRFTDLMQSDRDAIDRYLRKHPPLFFDDEF